MDYKYCVIVENQTYLGKMKVSAHFQVFRMFSEETQYYCTLFHQFNVKFMVILQQKYNLVYLEPQGSSISR